MLAPPIGTKPTTPCVESERTPSQEYPKRKVGGKMVTEHRLVYAAIHGDASIEGKVVQHACDNPRCIRYSHLRLGTNADNVRDSVAKGRHWEVRKTHCKYGHEFNEVNTRRSSRGKRICLTCQTEREVRRRPPTGQGKGYRNKIKTHCPSGHPYDGDNLYVRPKDGARICRACVRRHQAVYQRRKL